MRHYFFLSIDLLSGLSFILVLCLLCVVVLTALCAVVCCVVYCALSVVWCVLCVVFNSVACMRCALSNICIEQEDKANSGLNCYAMELLLEETLR